MISISERIHSMYDSISDKKPGEAFTRYKSWEYCHFAFNSKRKEKLGESDYDFLALHLAFYLASWGMYRGSSFLLQRDYKAHIKAVKAIMDSDSDIWNYNPKEGDENTDKEVAKKIIELGKKITESYGEIKERDFIGEDDKNELEKSDKKSAKALSDTLITKILMGTIGSVPAYDRFLKDAIRKNKKHLENGKNLSDTFNEKGLIGLYGFVRKYYDDFNIETKYSYPIMKKVDMYFWQHGYELGFLSEKSQFMTLRKKERNGDPLLPKDLNSKKKIIAQLTTFIKKDCRSLDEYEKALKERNE